MAGMQEKSAVDPPSFEAGPEVAGKLCSICQTAIIGGEQVLACPYCALPFHTECWQENRGCSAYGCQAAPKTVKNAPVTEPVSNAWGEEKPCPNCAKSIKAQALKCRFCGASFETRDVVTKDEYRSREYDGAEYKAVRNKLIALFLCSATGCLSPFTLIIAAVLMTKKQLMDIDYNRLPSTLKALVMCSIGLSSFVLFLAIMFAAFDK